MLTSLHLTDFKSFADAEVPFAPLTVLVGLNGAGKSNVLDAMRVLQGLALGFDTEEALDGVRAGGGTAWPGIRGGVSELFRTDELVCDLAVRMDVSGWQLRYSVGLIVGAGRVPDIRDEELWDVSGGVRRWAAGWHAGEYEDQFLVELGDATIEASPEGAFLARIAGVTSKIGDAQTDRVRAAILGTQFVDARPSLMREWVPAKARDIGASAERVSAVLARRFEDPAQKAGVEDWISSLLGGEAKSLEIMHAPTGDVMLALIDAMGARVTARSMSDGTLRFLGQIVAAEDLPSGRTLFMEEPDQGLHPSRLHLLVQKLEAETAPGRDKQIVVTTHSPQFLNWLSRDRWPGVVLIARDPATGASIARRVVDLPGFAELPADTLLGDLLALGWMEQAL